MTSLPESSPLDLSTRIISLRSQYDPGLLGVPQTVIRLSWVVESSTPGAEQLGYQLASATRGADWTASDPVDGPASIGIEGPGNLTPGERRWFAVRIATAAGWTEWSKPLEVEAGLSGPELEARVVTLPSRIGGPAPVLRKEFHLDAPPTRARLRLSALGLVDAWINGRPATDAVLTPGWTSYRTRILIDTLDVTELLHEGGNTIVLAVGDGWYRGRFGFVSRTGIYGSESGALAQLEIMTEAGTDVLVATDATWQAGFGAIRFANLYDGAMLDNTLDVPGLHEPGFRLPWACATMVDTDMSVFEPRSVAPVRRIAEFPMEIVPLASRIRLNGTQNISGWVRLVVRGRRGDLVTVRHAEVVEPDGTLHTAALRTAKATDTYVLGTDGENTLEPRFTFHGFQYADVTGADEVVRATAVAISTDLRPRSSFNSSHAALDRFHSNAYWSIRDNFVSVPTDCPQRDERLGWTADAQAIAPTATTLLDSEAFWMSWLRDLEIDQTDEGGVPSVVPNILRFGDMAVDGRGVEDLGRAGWADAAAIVPSAIFEAFGDQDVLVRQLGSMRRWVEHLRRRAGASVVLPHEDFQYGDWLDPDAPGERPWAAKVDSDFVANAFYVHSTRLLARAERLVGDTDRADDYDELANRVAAATWERWGEQAVLTQTGAALALEFGIVSPHRRSQVADALAADVAARNGRIATGFLGTPVVLFALANSGHLDAAYRMLLRRDAPSWLYQVDRGATTVWERWDAILPDGRIHAGDMATRDGDRMLSFNHYAYGAMIDWVYRTVAGLAPDPADPGYRTVHVAPRPAVGVDHASATIDTRLGRLAIDWTVTATGLEATLQVPFGARAMLDLPTTMLSIVTVDGSSRDHAPFQLTHGRHEIVVTAPSVARWDPAR